MFHQTVKLMGRQLMQNSVRFGSHGGVPGENLPFQIQNRYRLTAVFILFFGSGIAAPYVIVRHQLLKK
ncbi:Cytochrome c oxidase subunit 7C, mitochondrial [Pseudolycoriella hygida]|uniref:Cytochrome c oxidase subunit 7C, mitochondrial n=1 Tax=Pseudolycoriella hygida TaxID=35572 RepID=A0A9Q0MIV5_9DIPT|nr:Cytochrome c oxidase subunit 7C, mitochondrial [Pseudolycoriella hygida]